MDFEMTLKIESDNFDMDFNVTEIIKMSDSEINTLNNDLEEVLLGNGE